MLEVKDISFRYKGNPWLFKGINIAIHPGEIVGIYGPSGRGKTTMAKIIAGYIEPEEGCIKVDGHPLSLKGKNPVQLVWQHPEKTINPRWRMQKVLMEGGNIEDELLNELGIHEDWLTRIPAELSGGELQRICLARALGATTKYLIADEMTTMLDAITQAQIWHAVKRLVWERQLGVLAISHDLHLLQKICDRTLDFQLLVDEKRLQR